MSRVLLLGSHLGYNLEHYVKIALEKSGCPVEFFGYKDLLGSSSSIIRMAMTRSSLIRKLTQHTMLEKVESKINKIISVTEPDVLISIKGEAITARCIDNIRRKFKIRTVLWYPDDPRFFDSLLKHIAPAYDYVFTASEKMLTKYKEIGVDEVHYLPFACEPSVHKTIELSDKEIKRIGCDVSFVGTYYPRRGKIIKELDGHDVHVYGPHWYMFRHNVSLHGSVWGNEMVKVFNASKIALNIHLDSDLDYKANMKIFEISGSGAFMLTDRPYGLEKLFELGKEVICYENGKELRELVKYYLYAEEERKEISKRSQNRTYRYHTYEDRVHRILRLCTR